MSHVSQKQNVENRKDVKKIYYEKGVLIAWLKKNHVRVVSNILLEDKKYKTIL
jgi:hypothetical protein